jgi:hypothetical protein
MRRRVLFTQPALLLWPYRCWPGPVSFIEKSLPSLFSRLWINETNIPATLDCPVTRCGSACPSNSSAGTSPGIASSCGVVPCARAGPGDVRRAVIGRMSGKRRGEHQRPLDADPEIVRTGLEIAALNVK